MGSWFDLITNQTAEAESSTSNITAAAVCHSNEVRFQVPSRRSHHEALAKVDCAASARSLRSHKAGESHSSCISEAVKESFFQAATPSRQAEQLLAWASSATHSSDVPSRKIRSRSSQVMFMAGYLASKALLRGASSIRRKFFF